MGIRSGIFYGTLERQIKSSLNLREVDYSRHESLIQLAPEIVIEMDMEVNVDVAVVVSAAVTVTVR